jgi:anti-sigma factor ChrR (cupin superfamily)
MSSELGQETCDQTELVHVYALAALPESEVAAFEAHLSACPECRDELSAARVTVAALDSWPTDVLRPSPTLWSRLASRIAAETGSEAALPASRSRVAPEWEEVAPGISCKLLATDSQRDRVSMLVRLSPGAHYPPHVHAGVEELHLLHGELWIDDRKLHSGDYSRADAGTEDRRVWSETGCTCVLVTSSADMLC